MREFYGYFGDNIRPPQQERYVEQERLSPTARELQALHYTAHGLLDHECAEAMGVEVTTVKQHLKHARRTLGAKNTAHAVALALRLGLID